MIIEIHNEKGGVGCTTIAYHLIRGAQRIGLRVAAMSLDPTKSLIRELQGTETPIVEPGEEPVGDFDHLIIDRNTQCREPVAADMRIIPIRGRVSWELACDLSDRHPAPVLWVPSMTEEMLEIPEYLQGIVQLTPPIPCSHAVAAASWRRCPVWEDEELARSAGAHAMLRVVFDILRRALDPAIVLDRSSHELPIAPGASFVLGHGPHAGFRLGSLRPELRFSGEGHDQSAELQLLHLVRGRVEVLGSPWRHAGESPPQLRDLLGHAPAVNVGDQLFLKVTNTGARPITAARLFVEDDQTLAVPVHLPDTVPTSAPSVA